MKKTLLLFVVVIAIILSILVYINICLNKDFSKEEEIKIEIPRGSSIAKVVDIFNNDDMLKPHFVFTNYLKLISRLEGKHIFAGHYTLKTGETNKDVIEKLFSGGYIPSIQLTFPEGITLEDFARIASKAGADSIEFIYLCHNDSLIRARGIEARSIEGYLMPETYEFFSRSSASQIIDKLLDHHFMIWNKKFKNSAMSAGISHHQTITLASIIELETPIDIEKPRVSGVYHNRLRSGMLLQADPTVQYAVGFKGRVTYRDLEYDSPYNTYIYQGLPPGPICSPGEKAISAAIFPENHSYYYFVANGDGSGLHSFSKDYSEHQRNVTNYRKNRKKIKN